MCFWWVLFLYLFPLLFLVNGTSYLRGEKNRKLLNSTSDFPALKILRNKQVFFIGDSLTRYQYIALVYYLKHGQMLSDDLQPNPVEEKTWKTWLNFYNGTSSILGDYCDCYRDEIYNSNSFQHRSFENRFYYNQEYNIKIFYLQFFGHIVQGHWQEESDNNSLRNIFHEFLPPHWSYSLTETIRYIIPKMLDHQLSSYLILNVGHWANDLYKNETVFPVIQAALPIFHRIIWKTTSFKRGEKRNGWFDEDRVFCSYSQIHCMDISWTGLLEDIVYWDPMHFKPSAYNWLNLQLLTNYFS
jgi:hypothetical protein